MTVMAREGHSPARAGVTASAARPPVRARRVNAAMAFSPWSYRNLDEAKCNPADRSGNRPRSEAGWLAPGVHQGIVAASGRLRYSGFVAPRHSMGDRR